MNGRRPQRRRYRRPIIGLRQFSALHRYPFLAGAERRAAIHFDGWEKARRFSLTVTTTDRAHGLATLFDGDVLMLLATLLMERFDNSEPLDVPIEITLDELLERLGRHDDGRQRDLLRGEIARLHATCVHNPDLAPLLQRTAGRPHRRAGGRAGARGWLARATRAGRRTLR